MTLRHLTDLSVADWIVASDLPWTRLVTFGPSGFPAAAWLRFVVRADPAVEQPAYA